MKKIIFGCSLILIAACSHVSDLTNVDANEKYNMQSCIMTEAQSKYSEGTLFNNTVSSTAQSIVSNCSTQYAVSSTGMNSEYTSMAESIINSMKN